MRCLLTLEAEKNQTYNADYHVQLQGAVYRLIRKLGREDIHSRDGFKFLTFSNIFPPKGMKTGDKRTLIIASQDKELLHRLNEADYTDHLLEPGGQQYSVIDTSLLNIDIGKKGSLITGTPIVVRLPEEKAEEYDIETEYDDTYWRMDHPSKAFIDSIENNLARKYEEYYDRDAPERPYFSSFNPKKEVGVPLQYEKSTPTIIGTTWKVGYEIKNRAHFRIIEMALTSGIGELNTTGFGFMNKVEE